MLFGKKTQAELDAAFLNAVAKHKFDKAKKLLEQGANAQAVDAEGNTAFHKLAGYCPNRFDSWHLKNPDGVREFACLLLNKNLDINARNAKGQTCVHHMACALAKSGFCLEEMAEIISGCGAQFFVQDNRGAAPLHIAALKGHARLIARYFSYQIGIADNQGKYAHDYAVAGGHHILSQELRQKLEQHQAAAAQVQALKPVSAAPPPLPSNDNWTWLKPNLTVQHVEDMDGYKLTHIFNFSARVYTLLSHNLDTKQDAAPMVKGFDEFADKTLFVEARQAITQLGAEVDEALIYNKPVNKPAPRNLA